MSQQTYCIVFIEYKNGTILPDFSDFSRVAHDLDIIKISGDDADLIGKVPDDTCLVVINKPEEKTLRTLRSSLDDLKAVILVTDLSMTEYSALLGGKEEELVDHFLVPRESIDWQADSLRVTIQKIIKKDYFGVDKYLSRNTPIIKMQVQNPLERETINDAVQTYAEKYKMGTYKAKLIYGICEEMLLNAIYDAPASRGISPPKRHQGTMSAPVATKSKDTFVQFGCDGHIFALGVQDPFGGLSKKQFYRYVKKILYRHNTDLLIDTKESGAGLGLFKILYSSHTLICNVLPNHKTEVISLLYITEAIRNFERMNRSVQFFDAG